jgi:hypothetical protein
VLSADDRRSTCTFARLIGQLSNRQFISYLDKVLASAGEQAPAGVAAMCACRCGRLVAPGNKFVNQQHYDRSKGLSALASQGVGRVERSRGTLNMHLP